MTFLLNSRLLQLGRFSPPEPAAEMIASALKIAKFDTLDACLKLGSLLKEYESALVDSLFNPGSLPTAMEEEAALLRFLEGNAYAVIHGARCRFLFRRLPDWSGGFLLPEAVFEAARKAFKKDAGKYFWEKDPERPRAMLEEADSAPAVPCA